MRRLLLTIFTTVLCFNIYAQDSTKLAIPTANVDFSYTKPQKYVVENVLITGLEYLDPSQIESITGIVKGDTIMIPGQDLQFLMKKLWMQRFFSDIELKGLDVNGDKLTLNIFLQERPRVSSWDFVGVKKGEKDDLKEKLNLRRGGELSDYAIETSKNAIKKYLAEKGFLNAEVSIRQQKDTVYKNNYVKVYFVVDKKSKVKIKDINIDGNKQISDNKLRRSMKKTKQKRITTIFKSSKFIRSTYEEDLNSLVTYYNEKGYRDAKVLSDSVYSINSKRVGIDIKVYEGQKYYFRNISWVGNSIFTDEQLDHMLGLKKGDVYDKVAMEKMLFIDDASVSTTYNDRGYLFFYLDPVEVNIVGDSIDVEMRIVEGDQATFNRINIAGNTRTNEHVIRRELFTKPGELYSKSMIIESIRRLNNTGYFDPEKLAAPGGINIVPNRSEGTVDLTYNLEEKASDNFEISGGYGNDMFIGSIGFRFANFSTRRIFDKGAWRPLPSGDGQSLSVRAQTNGKYYRALSIGFVEPWLGGRKPTSLSVNVYHSTQTNSNYFYQTSQEYMKVTGMSVGLGKRLKWPDHNFTVSGEVGWQHYRLKDWPGTFIFDNGKSNNFSLKLGFGRYTLDNPIFPRDGSDFSLSVQLTPPYSLLNNKDYKNMSNNEKYKWIEYHKWSFKGAIFTRLAGKFVLMARAQMGYLGHYNSDIGHSPFEGYLVGGDGMSGYTLYGQENIGVRGYSNGSLTPYTRTNYGQMVAAANSYVKYTAEVRFPLIMQPQSSIYVLGFLEGGNSWYELRDFNPFAIKRSAGVGVRLLLPIVGLIGFHWGYGFDSVPNNPGAGGGQIHFEIGMPM